MITISNFSGCAIDPEDETKHWCSTKVDSSGNHIVDQNEHGDCSKNCPFHDNNPNGYDHHSQYLCYTLLQQGPCQSNQWFVANKFADTPSAECQICPCREDEILFNSQCHKNDSNTLCGDSQLLLLNPFGEGRYINLLEI